MASEREYAVPESLLKTFLINLAEKENSKSANKAPSFVANKAVGEGVPSHEELLYRQDLLDQLKIVYDKSKGIIRSNMDVELKEELITKLIDDYVDACTAIMASHLSSNYDRGQGIAEKKLADLGIKRDPDELPSHEPYVKLYNYQLMAIKKNATNLKMELIDLIYRADYWGVTSNASGG